MKLKFLSFLSILFLASTSYGQIVFTEDFGSSSGNTDSYSSAKNSSLIFTSLGEGDRFYNSANSSGYLEASGERNVLMNAAGEGLSISNIDVSSYSGQFQLNFGGYERIADVTGLKNSHMLITYETNLGQSGSLNFSEGTSNEWNSTLLQTAVFDITGASLLTLNFNYTYSGTSAVRFDDLTLSAIPEPSTYAALLGGLALCGIYSRRRKQQKA